MIGILPFTTEVELKKLPKATLTFILICSLVHIVTWRISTNSWYALDNWFDLTAYDFAFPFTALSCIFIHGDFYHIFFNMFFLFIFAAPLEVMEGRRKFWILVFISAIFSSYFQTFAVWMFSLYTHSADPIIEWRKQYQIYFGGIGASGVVSAFAMAYLVRFWRKRLWGYVYFFGIPVTKVIPIPAWVMVLGYWLSKDLYYGIFYQGLYASGGVGHFCHLGGDLAGLVLAFYWGFHKKHKRDYYLEHAQDLVKAPITGNRAAYKTYQQALELDPENGAILLALARVGFDLSRNQDSREYYRKAVLALTREQDESELVLAYQEAVERHHLIFLSERQLELVRLLLKAGKWKSAENILNHLCREIEARNLKQTQNSLYLRAKLILAWILDHYEKDLQQTVAVIQKLLADFPDHPLLKYPKERLANYGEENELFRFNPARPGFPFSVLKNPIAKHARIKLKLSWYRVRRGFMTKFALGLLLSPIVLIFVLWVLVILISAILGLLGRMPI